MPKGRGGELSQPNKKERFASTKRMINDEDGMGKILKHSGMFIVLIVWNVLEAFTRFIPSAIWVFIISGLLDALVNCLVIIFAGKLKGKNAWIWAAIIAGWNILTLFSHMLPINLWILIDIILDVIINILFLIFAPMILFDKSMQPMINEPSQPAISAEKPAVATSRPDAPSFRPAAASRPETTETKDTANSTTVSSPVTESVSENPLERDALKVIADLTHTNRLLAEQAVNKDGGDNKNAGISGRNDG